MSDRINPYREIAKLHNEGLNYVIKKLSRRKSVSHEEIIEIICEYLDKAGNLSNVQSALNKTDLLKLLNLKDTISLEKSLEKLDLGGEAKQYIKSLLSAPTSVKEAKAAQNMIKELEQTVLNSELKGRDRECVLLLIGIADLSIEYWLKEIKNDKSLWRKIGRVAHKIPWREDVDGAGEGLVEPGVGVLFGLHSSTPGILVVTVIGHSVYASVKSYMSTSEEERAEEIKKGVSKNIQKKIKGAPRQNPFDK